MYFIVLRHVVLSTMCCTLHPAVLWTLSYCTMWFCVHYCTASCIPRVYTTWCKCWKIKRTIIFCPHVIFSLSLKLTSLERKIVNLKPRVQILVEHFFFCQIFLIVLINEMPCRGFVNFSPKLKLQELNLSVWKTKLKFSLSGLKFSALI